MGTNAYRFFIYSILTILLISPAIPIVIALTEFIDDYRNEDYIAIKKKIIRNPTLNAMELNRSTKKKEEYEKEGYFYTTKILSDKNGSSLTILTNSTLNRGTIKVQFSSDNLTWVDHNNQMGYDSLREGFESIDLRDLNFDEIYIQFEFKRGKGKNTPRLYQTIMIFTDGNGNRGDVHPPPDDYSVMFLAIGLIFGLSIVFLYAKNR